MAISEQLDLISKEIGGKLDDNGNIEKQVQEIYDIIKSRQWPASGGGGKTGAGFIDTSNSPELLQSSGTVDKDGWLFASFYQSTTSSYQRVEMYINQQLVARDKLLPSNVDSNDSVVISFPIKQGQQYYVSTGNFTSVVVMYPMLYNEE